MTTPTTAMKEQLTTIELAKLIGQEPANIRKKAERLNGMVNFDRDVDAFTPEQLKAFLPQYLTGQRQLTGIKRKSVEKLLNELEGHVKETVKTQHEPSKPEIKQPIKAQSTPVQKAVKAALKPVKSTQSNPVIKTLSLVVAVSAVFWQSSHFAHLEAIESQFTGQFKDVASWGIAIGFESLALLLTVVSDKGSKVTWGWLIGFGVIAFLMNLSFYDCYEYPTFRKFVLSFALPFSIVATTHLFIKNRNQ